MGNMSCRFDEPGDTDLAPTVSTPVSTSSGAKKKIAREMKNGRPKSPLPHQHAAWGGEMGCLSLAPCLPLSPLPAPPPLLLLQER